LTLLLAPRPERLAKVRAETEVEIGRFSLAHEEATNYAAAIAEGVKSEVVKDGVNNAAARKVQAAQGA
jgi:hypothetical protein